MSYVGVDDLPEARSGPHPHAFQLLSRGYLDRSGQSDQHKGEALPQPNQGHDSQYHCSPGDVGVKILEYISCCPVLGSNQIYHH